MTAHPALFADPRPPSAPGVDLRCCDVSEMLVGVRGASLVHADPPWSYRDKRTSGAAEAHYKCLTLQDIRGHLGLAFRAAADDAYLLMWCTWPLLAEWMDGHRAMPWRYLTGGAWVKSGALGIGYHVRGNSEPWLLYAKGKPRPIKALRNEYVSPRAKHSAKPVPFLRRVVVALSPPDGLVVELYAGLGSMARACRSEGRPYVGAEIDSERHAEALALLARGAP